MSHLHPTKAAGQETAQSMSYVPPYREQAHTYISEQLATAVKAHMQLSDPTAPSLPARSPSVSPPSATAIAFSSPLSIPPPTRREATLPTMTAASVHNPPGSASSSFAIDNTTQPTTTTAAASSTPRAPPVAPYLRPPSPPVPSRPPTAPPTPVTAAIATLLNPPPHFSPPPATAPAPSPVAAVAAASTAYIPELRVILARGRLSGVQDFSPEATGEDIYRAFCPAGDTYLDDSVPVTAATAAAATTTTTFANALGASGASPAAPSRLCNGAAPVGLAATRGRLPPGWERRVFHNSTFYLDHISREAHEQEPWVVWWGRAGNAVANGE